MVLVLTSHERGSMFSIKSKAAISMSFLKKVAAFAGRIILNRGISTMSYRISKSSNISLSDAFRRKFVMSEKYIVPSTALPPASTPDYSVFIDSS